MDKSILSDRKARIAAGLGRLGLTRQFVLAGSVVAIVAMLVVGFWASDRIARDATESAAAATALYMDSFIAPLAQELAEQDTLSIGPIRALDELLAGSGLKDRVVSIKIWKKDGGVAYARDLELMGKRFPPSENLVAAFGGATVAELDRLDDPESADEAAAGIPLLEIYSPVRAAWTGDIIAVAEFYEDASPLVAQIEHARIQGWLVTALVTMLIGVTLIGIVHRGSRLIEAQRKELAGRLVESERMTRQNQELRLRAEQTTRRIAEINELNLRRIGADLHDGAAQQIGFAALRLDAVRGGRARDTQEALSEIAEALRTAMEEIRQISRGLTLPELDSLSLDACIDRAIRAHEKRTGTSVDAAVDVGESTASGLVKVCVYRFVQEGLNNAFRHGQALDQAVAARISGDRLVIQVTNRAPENSDEERSGGLGLSGLRERVEGLGGDLTFRLNEGGQSILSMEIDLPAEAADE
ncbi:MAG: sensor histidine kinase [Rhizobiaceae bacterium]|nr:sensor histidine kinase [Rhizobiaceae bacterium]